jgi:hypothetical protein
MMDALRKRLTYANVTSTLALFIAVGAGSAFAANQLALKSVGAPQLRPGAVTADKIRKNAVTSPKLEAQAVKQGKVANGAIVTEKIANGAVNSAKIAGGAIASDKIPNDSVGGEKIIEGSLSQVPSANSANFATTAQAANPEAFAKVNAEGTVFPGDSRGIGTADVILGKAFAGIYCIAVPFSPKGVQVTPIYTGHNSVTAYVSLGGTENCSAAQVEVQTYSAGTHQQEPFYIVFYR